MIRRKWFKKCFGASENRCPQKLSKKGPRAPGEGPEKDGQKMNKQTIIRNAKRLLYNVSFKVGKIISYKLRIN